MKTIPKETYGSVTGTVSHTAFYLAMVALKERLLFEYQLA
jgi:CO/xanthine dehydrogenase Mo-binding subunit